MSDSLRKAAIEHVWNGLYATWAQACEAAKVHGDAAFSSENWSQRITRQLLDYRNEYRQFGIALPPRPSNLPLVCAMLSPDNIMDFGGSSGWCWDYLQNSLTMHSIASYIIVELATVASHMKVSGLHGNIVKYKTLDDLHEPCDLLYSNSVLQYFSSNAPLISLVERTTPDFIFLEDVIAKGEEDVFTTQSYYGSAIPYRFIGLERLIDDLSSVGYHELLRCPYASPVFGAIRPLPMENFPEESRLRYSLSILLRKTGNQ